MAKKPCGKDAADFVRYLRETLIPDLRESGRDYTADDFETAIKHINKACALKPAKRKR